MEPIRGLLPGKLVEAMVRSLGREEALRLLWPALVGSKLAAQTALRTIRGTTLVVAVPELPWARSLQPLEGMLLEAVNRFPRCWQASAVDYVVDAGRIDPVSAGSRGQSATPAATRLQASVPASERAGLACPGGTGNLGGAGK